MTRTKTMGLTLGLMLTVSATFAADSAGPVPKQEPRQRHIDIAICLDTSGSMQGLIESAKQKLWAVVSELAMAKPRPALRVALYQYGNDGLSRENGWVERLCNLTDNLDEVYGKLFPLRTNGGTEYVARVVRAATDELKWDTNQGTLRIIFVAGNEPATQDEATYKLQDICKAAASKGIIVNTVFCGREDVGRKTGWSDAAVWADGRFAAIDHNSGTVVLTTPFDKKLVELNAKLNSTYVAYGKEGDKGRANQAAQDRNAATKGLAVAAERAGSKATELYTNAGWDLVDAVRDKKIDLEKAKADDLPEPMQKMNVEERKAYVAQQSALRADIQEQIKKLSAQRDEYAKQEMAKQNLSDKSSLDAALRAAIREQAEKKEFRFEGK